MSQATKTVGIYSYGRKQSQRCPNKVLRPFGDTTLCDIMMAKLKEVGGENAFYAGYEDEFQEKAQKAGVKFVKRSEESALIDAPITKCQEFLRRVDYDYLLIVNTCLPFLKIKTIKKFLEDAIAHDYQPAVAVSKTSNYFFSSDGVPVNFPASIKTLNTKTVTPLLELANALYFFNRDYFFKNGRYWDWQSVRLIELKDKSELLDVDTEDDFTIAQKVWQATRAIAK